MSDLYLSRVRIEDFRTFGHFDVNLPAGPGLTLLVGPNGLGKSSFFDALEWGLTGRVRRFERYLAKGVSPSSYLTRRGAAQPHGVHLSFSDGGAVHRQGSVEPDPAQVIAALKAPDWGAAIQDLGTYLAFTHFLGQGEHQRFTSRDAKDQWQALKAPSGIDRLERIRFGLRGRPTSLAFSRRIKLDDQAVEETKQKLAEWRSLADRLRTARETSGAVGGADPLTLRLALRALDARLASELHVDVPADSDETLTATLTRQLGVLRSEKASAQQAVRRLDDLTTTPERYAALAAAASPEAPALVLVKSQAAEAKTTLDLESAAVVEARSRHDVSAAEADSARDRVTALSSIEADRSGLAAAELEQSGLSADRVATVSDLDAARADLHGIERNVADSLARAQALSRAAAGLAAAEGTAQAARLIPGLRERAARAADEAGRLGAAAETARAVLPGLIERRETLSADRERAQSTLALVRARAGAISAAVAQIAAHLDEHDAACPVCQTSVGAGELLRLARDSARAASSELAVAEEAEVQIGSAFAETVADIEAAKTAIIRAENAEAEREAAEQAASKQEDLVRPHLPDETADLVEAAEASRQAATDAFNARLRNNAGYANVDADAVSRKSAVQDAISALTGKLAQLDGALASVIARRDASLARLHTAGVDQLSDDDFGALVAEAVGARAAAEAEVVEARRVRDDLVARLAEAERIARDRQTALDQAEAAGVNAGRAADILAESWSREGLPKTPDAVRLEARRREVLARVNLIDGLEDLRSQHAAAYDLVQNQADLQSLIAEMETLGGEGSSDDPDGVAYRLEATVKAAEETLSLTRNVNLVVRRFSRSLQDRANQFSTDFLEPLNDLIGVYNEALLSRPGDSVRFDPDTRVDKNSSKMGLSFRDPFENNLFDKSLPPQVILSEGQLAANGFSILCAASTAYRWSRWRALMLDDPLQHSDIIHGAAFVDLMRNLVEMRGYQLLMSSHDRAEAEFISRKFDAAGLPCKLIYLTSPSRSGVKYDEPLSSPVTQALLGNQAAAAG